MVEMMEEEVEAVEAVEAVETSLASQLKIRFLEGEMAVLETKVLALFSAVAFWRCDMRVP